MRYLIDGKPYDGVPERDLRDLIVSREMPEIEAVLVAADEALRRGKKSLTIRYAVVGVIIAVVPPLAFAADPRDWTFFAPIIVAIWAFFAWYMPFMYRRKLGRFAARIAATNLPAPPGTTVRADETGLAIGAKSWPWSRLAIDTIGMMRLPSSGGDVYTGSNTTLQSLGLVAGGEHIQLDGNMLSTGNRVLDQIYRRLKPAE